MSDVQNIVQGLIDLTQDDTVVWELPMANDVVKEYETNHNGIKFRLVVEDNKLQLFIDQLNANTELRSNRLLTQLRKVVEPNYRQHLARRFAKGPQ